MRRASCWSWLALLLLTRLCCAAEFHVVPVGSPLGNGSPERPWDLATALAGPKEVRPGDTIWIHAGTYRGGYLSKLSGTRDQPITVRGEKGSRVTIDTNPRNAQDNGLLMLQGADVIYRDFEVTCSHPLRETNIAGPWPENIRRGAVEVRGDRLATVNIVAHDLLGGFGFWSEGEGGEVSGCIIYNNGWRGPDRDHGHAIYAQNARGTKRIANNILFHQFAYGIHAYGSEKASLKGFEITGNVAFENGCFRKDRDNTPGIFVGGGSPVERLKVCDNVVVSGGIRLGYPWGAINEDVVCTGNYCDQGLVLRDFHKATIMKNSIAAASNMVMIEGEGKALLSGHCWDENEYFISDGRWGELCLLEGKKGRGLTYHQWRNETGFDARSTFTKGLPSKQRIIVQANAYEAGRANIAVLNPAAWANVEVDLSQVLSKGQKYRIVSVKDFYGAAIVSGVYDCCPVRVPMQPVPNPQPIGLAHLEIPVCEPHFAAFVVLPE